jgi:hypothetical protein
MADYIRRYADISSCGRYRYLLEREWRGTHDRKNWDWWSFKDGADADVGEPKSVLFVMLNPSTADGTEDDPTIRRCVGFAKAWKYEALAVVNLFAYRATDPKELFKAGDSIHGPRNEEVIERAARDAGIIVCAWGAHGSWGEQDETVRGWMNEHSQKLHALGFTKHGHPKHPLYLPADATPIRMPEVSYA